MGAERQTNIHAYMQTNMHTHTHAHTHLSENNFKKPMAGCGRAPGLNSNFTGVLLKCEETRVITYSCRYSSGHFLLLDLLLLSF